MYSEDTRISDTIYDRKLSNYCRSTVKNMSTSYFIYFFPYTILTPY